MHEENLGVVEPGEVEGRSSAVKIYCPFKDEEGKPRCGLGDCDEFGYCRHFMGLFNGTSEDAVGQMYEPVKDIMTWRENPETGAREPVKSGKKMICGGHHKKGCVILKTDKLVNPGFKQKVDGVVHVARRWVSWRVYRDVDAKHEEKRSK